jgi:hypothetical protein
MADTEPNPTHMLHLIRKCYLELNETQARLEAGDEANPLEAASGAITKCKNILCLMGSRIAGRPNDF